MANVELRPVVLSHLLKTYWNMAGAQRHRVVLVESGPGTGKTTLCAEAAREDGRAVVIRYCPLLQPEDLGLPQFNNDLKTHYFTVPDWYPSQRKVDAGEIPERGVLLLDEFSQCREEISKPLAAMFHMRSLHSEPMAEEWEVVLTGNQVKHRAGAYRLLSHIDNRITRLSMAVHLEDLERWMIAHEVEPEVVTYTCKFKSDRAYAFDPDREGNPTPRSWVEGVSPLLKAGVKGVELLAGVQGAIGTGDAEAFIAFLDQIASLPDMRLLLAQPETYPLPTKADVKYAISCSLAKLANKDNIEAVMKFAMRLEPDYAMSLALQVVSKDKNLINCPSVRDLVIKIRKYIV